jgi:hypothetical protein
LILALTTKGSQLQQLEGSTMCDNKDLLILIIKPNAKNKILFFFLLLPSGFSSPSLDGGTNTGSQQWK